MTTRGSPVYTSSNFSMPIILRASVLNGQAGQLRYRLLSPQESYFTVDSTSGALRVAEPISFEMVCITLTKSKFYKTNVMI